MKSFKLDTATHHLLNRDLADMRDVEHAPGGRVLRDLRQIGCRRLPPALTAELQGMLSASDPAGLIHIANSPRDTLIRHAPLPHEDKRKAKPTVTSEAAAALFAAMIGEPFGFAQEDSRLVNDLIPRQSGAGMATGVGTADLGLHIEHAAFRTLWPGVDRACRAIVLTHVLGERNQPPAFHTADARDALAGLPDRVVAVLKEPRFLLRVPVRFRADAGSVAANEITKPSPLVMERPDGCGLRVAVALYGDVTSAVPGDATAAAALQAFKAALNDPAVLKTHEPQPGDTFILLNDVVLHGRGAYTPWFDEAGRASRWVQRVLVAESLAPLQGLGSDMTRVYRPIPPAF